MTLKYKEICKTIQSVIKSISKALDKVRRKASGRLFHNLGTHTLNDLSPYKIRTQTKGGEMERSEAGKCYGQVSKRSGSGCLVQKFKPNPRFGDFRSKRPVT